MPLPAWALWLLGAGMAGLLGRRRAAEKAGLARLSGLVCAAALFLAASTPAPLFAADLDLGYDANGNVVSKTTPSGTSTFSYDALDRIDTEAGPVGARNHDFDANGNRTADGAGTTAAYAPASDRIQTVNGVAVTLDAAGNLVDDGSYKYAWNALGQLAEIRLADDTLIASYHYDHRNLRTRKVTTAAAPQGISKTFYHYDEADRLIAETAPGNVPLMTYVWNGDRLTGLIVHQPARTVYAVQTDHLGSPFQVRTLTGTVVWRWEPEAFGKTQPNEDVDGDGTKLTLNLRFPGQYFDAESGLHYNWNRYYSPRLARYISSDPIGIVGGLNLYSYVGGNPLRYVDPEGLDAEDALPMAVIPAIPSAAAVCSANPVACAVGAAGAVGYGVGTLINPYVEKPISKAVDWCLSKSGVSEEEEAECFAQYERDLDECKTYRSAYGARWYRNCKANAFKRYQACRGY